MTATYTIGALSKALKQNRNKGKEEDKLQSLFRVTKKNTETAPVFVPQETQQHTVAEEQKKRKRERTELADDPDEKEEEIVFRKQRKTPKFPRDSIEDDRTVFVGNLPNTIDRKGIAKMFRKYGRIESVRLRSAALADPKVPRKLGVITRDFNKNRSNINAYVKFSNADEASSSLKLNGKIVNGFHLRVDLESKSKEHDNTKSVFIGNLPFNLQEEAVYSHFEDCGQIDGIRLIRDAQAGIGKGFGYVLFQTKHSVEFALRLDGSELSGRNIRVTRAVKNPKKKFINIHMKKEATKMKKKEGREEKRSKKKFLAKYLKKTPKDKKRKQKKMNVA